MTFLRLPRKRVQRSPRVSDLVVDVCEIFFHTLEIFTLLIHQCMNFLRFLAKLANFNGDGILFPLLVLEIRIQRKKRHIQSMSLGISLLILYVLWCHDMIGFLGTKPAAKRELRY